jgi:hypothetical protein
MQMNGNSELITVAKYWKEWKDPRFIILVLSADRPVVYEAYVDPNVPPLPPHITIEQAKHFAQSLLKGDVDTGGVLKQSIKGMVDKLTPRKD